VRPIDDLANPNYLFNLCKSPIIEHQFETGSKATTQAAFGIKKVRLLAVPFCSLTEQAEIVKNLGDCLTRTSRLEYEIEKQMKKVEKNKQSILTSVFSGRL
jgi:type I restriction enzyme S subunit